MTSNFPEKYRELITASDSECNRLKDLHAGKMACRMGCSACCMDFSLFPLEFYSIAEALNNMEFRFRTDTVEGECPMLIDDKCSIYEHRPFICRSHGFPLLSMGDEEWELTHCELNFTEGNTVFDESNTLVHDRINSSLFLLNRDYIKTLADKEFSEFDLIPLSQLVTFRNTEEK